MKKKILITIGVLAVIAIIIAAIEVTCRARANYTVELSDAMNSISKTEFSDLLRETSVDGKNWWASVPGGKIQKGILKLKNREIIRFAFISHHASKDRNSHAYFQGSKYRKYIIGWFCCEVEFYNKRQPRDTAELDAMLSKYDGIPP